MVQTTQVCSERVSPSAIKSVFGQLKSNGYSHGQIMALSLGLSEMAQVEKDRHSPMCVESSNRPETFIPFLAFEYDLSLLGL